jgi:hypothetical protein
METWWSLTHTRNRRSSININVGSIPKEMIYDIFFNPGTRRLIKVNSQGINAAMALTEDINVRKQLLIDSGIISNPFNLAD